MEFQRIRLSTNDVISMIARASARST